MAKHKTKHKKSKKRSKKQKAIEATFIKTLSGKELAVVEGKQEQIYSIINSVHNALHKDKVKILPLTNYSDTPSAQLISIISRAREKVAGTVVKKDFRQYLSASDPHLQMLFPIQASIESLDQDILYEAKLKYPDSINQDISAIVTRALGLKTDHEAQQKAILINHGFDPDYPPAARKEAMEIQRKWHSGEYKYDEKNREDFRKTLTFTIDPEDAKDFDDAISVKHLQANKYEIGIHIADVSFFVAPNSAIDKEAQNRATSVYMVDRTIHMLPEELSSDVCSLVPGEDRFAFSVIFNVSFKDSGVQIDNFRITPTIINSNYRLTYKQAQEILDTKKHEDKSLIHALEIAEKLADSLKSQRQKEHALEFTTKELEFVLDENKKPIAIKIKPLYKTNSIIEELMLLANKTVASWFSKHAPYKFFVFRVHDEPDHEKIKNLNIFLNAYGLGLNKKIKQFTRKQISQILKQVKDTEIEDLVHQNIIRSLAKAQYHFQNIGHFSLGFDYYTHFTSPIRRYPDIMVHRILKAHLNDTKIPKEEINLYRKLTKHSTEKEIEAMQAERESIKQKQIEYFQDKIGQEFDGVVTGVIKNGIFVTEKTTLTEGFLPASELKGWFKFDEKNYALVSKNTNKSYKVGDSLKVRLAKIDPDLKTITWTVVD